MYDQSTTMLVSSGALGFITLVAGTQLEPYNLPLGPGIATPGDPFWMQSIKHQGIAAYNQSPNEYHVFRNVMVSRVNTAVCNYQSPIYLKDFGAKGDGISDDTKAIKFTCLSLPFTHVLMIMHSQCRDIIRKSLRSGLPFHHVGFCFYLGSRSFYLLP